MRNQRSGSNAKRLLLPGLSQSRGQITDKPEQRCSLCATLSGLSRLPPQANLVFDPTALLPGASPKSPGLKAMVSPFHSPPSTPSSPGVRSRASESEEVPVSFDQPPEGSHLPCYNKVPSGPQPCGLSVESWAQDNPEGPLPCFTLE